MSNRIITLDVIRGVAVMGIFSVNVVAFAMVEAAYFNPPVYGFDGLADRLMWLANFILVDGKMRSLFSILFGASMLLVADRADASGQSATGVHYRRMAVLLLFGLAHFYFIWFGDILTTYAVVGSVVFLFRRFNVAALAAFAVVAYILAFANAASQASAFAARIAVALASGDPDAIGYYGPSAASIARDLAVHSSWPAYVATMIGERLWNPLDIVRALFMETFALMLIGMAAYRSGFLNGQWPAAAYRRIAIVGIALGAAFSAVLAAWVWADGFRLPLTVNALETWSMPAHPVMALAYAAALVLAVRKGGWLIDRLAAVGRAAFTNYLGTSIVAMLVFNGSGLGLYGQLSRAECWLLVPLVWLLMLLWSKPWLDRFTYGPLEWAWRSLSRLRPQPMLKRA
ncbi:DUF418 domain-containing protein [Sphingomonas sabuli]|uniref:DUF418 domain-containing protein n=1 Tax=Sphingomonas sabuli TaxID=2764186 RepID=A0A7G9L1L3_9SPHN|nr:DUF418 domain-containing protein [Sphingomonas sabuli]QNM82512.1 DUF418 domain-containing protein [Sphingomonas sabuli]